MIYLIFQTTSTYHAGAVVAIALDTIFFPLQANKGDLLSLADLVKRLTSDGRKAVGMSCAVPLRNKGALVCIIMLFA